MIPVVKLHTTESHKSCRVFRNGRFVSFAKKCLILDRFVFCEEKEMIKGKKNYFARRMSTFVRVVKYRLLLTRIGKKMNFNCA